MSNEIIVNDELGRIWKEAIVDCCKVLSQRRNILGQAIRLGIELEIFRMCHHHHHQWHYSSDLAVASLTGFRDG
jgi:hypothetical protein